MGTTLHVAAMPFPTHQGTQAAVHAMARATGEGAHLLTYGSGQPDPDLDAEYVHHRAGSLPGREDFRSGPSVRKVVQDAQLAWSLRQLHRRLSPDRVIAHHVEAAALALAAGVRPLVFMAHTALGPELPCYFPSALAPVTGNLGARLDQTLCRRVDTVTALSPALRDFLRTSTDRPVHYVPIPWRVPDLISDNERHLAREKLGIEGDREVVLYTGNLDAYQGWEDVVAAITKLSSKRPNLLWVVATASDPHPLVRECKASGIADRVIHAPIKTEHDRRNAHAAADVAVVPRRNVGGVPIKLLESLSRGVPTVVTKRASSGLPVGECAEVVDDDAPEAIAAAVETILNTREHANSLGRHARRYVHREHHGLGFTQALDRASRG